jgi:hypothetical protein
LLGYGDLSQDLCVLNPRCLGLQSLNFSTLQAKLWVSEVKNRAALLSALTGAITSDNKIYLLRSLRCRSSSRARPSGGLKCVDARALSSFIGGRNAATCGTSMVLDMRLS